MKSSNAVNLDYNIIIEDNLKNSIKLNDNTKKKLDFTIMDMDCEIIPIRLKENTLTDNTINYDEQIIDVYKPKFNLLDSSIRNKIKYYHLFYIYQIDRIFFNIFELIFCYVFQCIEYNIDEYIVILIELNNYKKIFENIMNDVYVEKEDILKYNFCKNQENFTIEDFINDFTINNISHILQDLIERIDIIQKDTLSHCNQFKLSTN